MKRSLLLAALTAVAQSQRPQQQPKEPQPLPIEPGHVMSMKTYERLYGSQQK